MSSFVETRFPEDISYGSSGGPEFNTDIVDLSSGHEQRNANWSASRAKYNVAHGIKTQTQLDALIAFFRARRGKAVGFRFKDWTDYTAVNQILGTGDGANVTFSLRKVYSSGGVNHYRDITKPVTGTVKIYVNSVLKTVTTDYTINMNTGVITFVSAPPNGQDVTADFEFDVPVRFDTDKLNASINNYNSMSWNDIPLVEVRV
jgi:uncharacterized protein (TIGR02217 family)